MIILQQLNLNIRLKIAIGYILIICCLGVSIIVVTDRLNALQKEIETITNRDIEIHNLIAAIQYNVISMETSQRGFIITGNDAYLEPYIENRSQWEANFNSLYQFISDHPSTGKDLEGIKLAIQQWINTTGDPAIELRKDNNMEEILPFFTEGIGSSDIHQLRSLLESLRGTQIELTKTHILQLDNRNTILTFGLYAMLVVVAIVAFSIVSYVSGSIVRTIKQVTTTITEIASSRGDLTTRIKVRTRDEIKDLAEATNELLSSLQAQSWIQTNVAVIATMNQGTNDITTLGQTFLSKVAPMVNAAYGVFYIRRGTGEQERLDKVASYATSGNEVGRDSFRIGEGIVGQCALDNRAFLLNQPPDHHSKITTGLTELIPQSTLVVPVQFEDKVVAVIEFASLESFTTQHLKLLEQIEDHFGVAVDNVIGRMEVGRLLSESQLLTKELQAQTEELQAQSEELQMQQEEMRMTTEHLEEQNLYAEQKTKELEKAKAALEEYSDKLKQSAQYKSNFLANMSHELRTPLNSILILSQLLYENEHKTLTAEEEGYAQVIHASGNDLLALIDDILDLSKVEAGKLTLVLDEVNVSEIPDMMRLSFDPIAEKKQIDFHIELQQDIPQVLHTDGQRLQQILKNLLSNAFKFTEQGSVILKIHKADPAIVNERLPMGDTEAMLAFSVIDTGIGIPKDKQELIFEAFQQEDGNINRLYGGTGLGLSICNEFAQLMGGFILLDSDLHKGSSFTLCIPCLKNSVHHELESAQEEAAPTIEPSSAAAESVAESTDQAGVAAESPSDTIFKNKKVLLAEDDARNVFAIVKALEKKGLHVTVAGNGQECLEIIKQQPDFDIVLVDIMMPKMDGFETMEALRRQESMQNIPIIALTAKAMKSDREKCLKAGASDYISKPIQMEQLLSLMRVWLTKQVDH